MVGQYRMKGLKLEIAHFALRWHAAKGDEWEAMGSERRVFLGEVHPSLTRRGPSNVGASCREVKRGPVPRSTFSFGGSSGRGTATQKD